MERLEQTLKEIVASERAAKRKSPALMTHVVLGYPTLQKSIDIVLAMANAGASIIELQIPFSDPMADGPTIMAANEAALLQGIKVKDCLKAAEKLSAKTDVPLLFMSYYNILYRYSAGRKRSVDVRGVSDFCRDARAAGIEGLIVPDVPPEENAEYWKVARDHDLAPIPIVTPISTDARLRKIRSVVSGGFIYCVTTAGTTGARKSLPKDTPQYLKRVRKYFSEPLAVGFGISNRAQVQALGGLSEIAIIGSALVQKIQGSSPREVIPVVEKYLKSLQ